ncbi:MAG: PAS domain-containing protein [Acidobacteria bacterium]|nr:PAS domain-containing protein [Acidobacteriota bacterium]MCA1642071.1 PAS domain-containing protein [Acidobacteriota bacterium]
MGDEKKSHESGEREEGRVVYSRLPTGLEGEHRAPTAGGGLAALLAREPVAPALPVMVVSFVLLVIVVFALGRLSSNELRNVSDETQKAQQRQTLGVQFLLDLRGAFTRLDFEARDRGTRESRGGIINPFDSKLGNARDEARRQLYAFERRPLAQTQTGQAFVATARDFIESTLNPDAYSTGGFVKFRELDRQAEQLLAEANKQQQEVDDERRRLYERAQGQTRRLTYLAVILSALIAAASVWELQRRFRQLRRSLEESRRERAFSAQMLEGMVSAVAAIDGRDRVRSANRSFLKLFPRAPVGSSVHDEIAPPDAMKMFSAATSARVEESTYRGRWVLTPEGENDPRHFEVYSSPLNIDGEHGQILTLVDVTEAAHNETELRRKTALAAVGQAAAQVAHEIKNPLGSIRLGVAMLRDMTSGEEAHSTINLVERGIEHLNKLTVDVTQYSREKPLALSTVELHKLIDSSLELVEERLRERETPVEKNYTDDPLAGELDADQLQQVFINLVANAADASPKGAPVTITTARTEGRIVRAGGNGDGAGAGAVPFARLTVADRGAGMDEGTRARVFEPFFTTKQRGTGLGLAIVKKIVEQHGGTITVESAPGEGTSFHVELPLRQDQ